MQYVLLLLIVPLVLLGACTDVPRYTADQVIEVARSYSPDCPGSQATSPSPRAWDTEPMPWDTDSASPSWSVEYLGSGKWLVRKDCESKTSYWHFYEDTGKLVRY